MERHRIDKAALRETITSLEGLTNEQKAELLQLLSEQKRYGLVWEDHAEDVEEQLRTQLPVLCEDSSKRILSADEEAPNHILIEGDNLHALTALTYTHEGKVDVIYIDPPYNTGNKDFVYNDSFVDKDDSFRHSKWLSFMHKRLKIAKRLLSDRGVIFISIDDNEQANLKLLCDEVFGSANFVCSICRQAIKGGSRADNIRVVHDYVLTYAKNLERMTHFTGEEKEELNLNLFDEKGPYMKGRELNKWGAGSRREDSPSMWFPIIGPNGEEVYPIRNDGSEGRWRWGKKKMLEAAKNNEIIFEKRENGTYIAYEKVRGLKNNTKQFTTWFADNYINAKGSETVKAIFNTLMSVFSFAKPVELVHDLLFMANSKDSLILDFFAGSGTTLHATMQLNAEDGGHRQCILVTNNENGICENVTYERNRRVIQGYTTPKGVEVPGLSGNNLRYYRTDFVERETTRTAKRQLMMASTELLCIKHDIYDEQRTFGRITLRPTIARYFTGGKQQMLIIYRTEAIESLVAEIAEMPESTNILVYVFSTTNYAMDADFEEVSDKVTLCALPAAIYNAYLRVLPKRRMNDALRYDDDALRYDDNALDDDALRYDDDAMRYDDDALRYDDDALRYDDDNDNDNMGGTEA